VLTSGTGAVEETCSSLAFGDGLNCSGSGADATEHHFTGKERDAESGLDYFGARYYASTAGRFLSPDPSAEDYADRSNPQSLNLYAYVMNSPLTLTDPDGECATLHAGIGQGPNTKNGASLIALAQTYGANVAFPYEGQSKVLDVLDIAGSLFGANDRAAQVSSDANDSGFNDSQVGGTTFLSVGFSGGASSSLLGGGLNRTNSIFYDPGLGLGQFRGSIPTYHGGLGSHPFDPASPIVNATSAIGPSYAGSAACTHDVVCAIKSNAALANALQSAGPCVLPRIFRPHQPPQALQPYIYVPFYNFDLLESNDSSSVTTSQRDNIPPPSK
jgi:RHS repeat-associated protein